MKRRQRLKTLKMKALLPAMLRSAVWQLRFAGWRSYALFLLFQAVTGLIALPVIRWMFGEVLSSAGLHGFDMNTFGAVLHTPLSLAWLVGLVLLALLVSSIQLAVLLLACASVRAKGHLSLRQLWQDMAHLPSKVLRPRSWLLLAYLFVILPLSQFGFLTAVTSTISVPNFVSDELMKSTPGIIGYIVFLILLFWLNVRLALVIPLFALTDATGTTAFTNSWRLTRQGLPSMLAAVATVMLAANLVGFVLMAVGTLPTFLTDTAAPELSPVVAAVGLAFAEVLALLLLGMAILALCGILLELLHRALPLAPRLIAEPVLAADPGRVGKLRVEDKAVRRGGRHGLGTAVIAGTLVAAMAVLAVINVPVMQALHVQPATLVLGHRGFSDGGVENTIPGLEAAAAAGADKVEMDVMETADGEFVVMHDANLQRLAGVDRTVASLTLAEITGLQIKDMQGHTAYVPSLRDYLLRARDLRMSLLVEIKLHGGERPGLVPRLVAEMEELDAFDGNIFHSLDLASVEELKALRPAAYAGYIMAFAGVAVPKTTVDFIVVGESSYSGKLRDDAWAAGKEIYVWTVNTDVGQRKVLRERVDGIITDHPDMAKQNRTEIGEEGGLFGTLIDSIDKFVVAF